MAEGILLFWPITLPSQIKFTTLDEVIYFKHEHLLINNSNKNKYYKSLVDECSHSKGNMGRR